MADNMNFEIKDFHAGSEDQKLTSYLDKLNEIRKDGVHKEMFLSEEIATTKRDKTIDAADKENRIKALKE